ncbi:hypothetical protein O0L34_g10388 [Tuta absoluta]|nr:hypothetical protein O0L34_g10388 [Tuta absoluta]
MSSIPTTPRKRNNRYNIKSKHEDNNNTTSKFSERQQARTFIQWFKQMVDNERQNLCLYMSDDATLEWFGRTIKTRKKVSSFLKYDMQCSRHDFTTVESIDKIQTRQEMLHRKEDSALASPLQSPELKPQERSGKRRLLRSNCNSPEWAEGCKPDDEYETNKKKHKNNIEPITTQQESHNNILKRESSGEDAEIGNKGDGIIKRGKRKCVLVTPPNKEVGQGDCMPSTSTDSNKSHDALNAQLPKLAVECNGYIEFARTKNNRTADTAKWERKCKVQISYSEDPLNVGEYIIWALRYTDESKCRRNLLAAFEEAAKDELKNV